MGMRGLADSAAAADGPRRRGRARKPLSFPPRARVCALRRAAARKVAVGVPASDGVGGGDS